MALIATVLLTFVLTFATVVGAAGIAKLRNTRARFAIALIVALFLLVAPFALEVLTAVLIGRKHTFFYDLRAPALILPSIAVVGGWLTLRRLAPRHASVLVPLWAWCSFSGFANALNQCSPGWCSRYGFPFAYYAWSDAVVMFDGEPSQNFHPTALLLDAALVILCAGALAFRALRPKRV